MDRFHEVTKKRIWNDNLRTLITLAVVFVLVLVSMLGTYKVLLINSRKMGHELYKAMLPTRSGALPFTTPS